MTNNRSPLLRSFYVLFPLRGSTTVVDFWSSLITVGADSEQDALNYFPTQVAKCLRELGYEGDVDGVPHNVSFSTGIIGVARTMLLIHNHRASVILYFKRIADYGYVSLRVTYTQAFSWLKILRFILVVMTLVIIFPTIDALTYPDYLFYSYGSMTRAEFLANRLVNMFTNNIVETALVMSVIATFVFLISGFVSWWRTGFFLAFLREDFQEVYRDDMASIGQAAYDTVTNVADSLSLIVIATLENATPPAFGTGTSLAPASRRAKRL